MTVHLTNLKLNPPIFLAPMAGVTDFPSRQIAQLFGPGLVVSEMIASSEQDKNYFEKTVKSNLSDVNRNKDISPTAIQIAGHEIEWMKYAAKLIEFEGGDLIDINMGCPAKKIVGKFAGSALMKEPSHALRMLESIVKATNIPVTLKMRLGWDLENINAPLIAKSAENIGIQMITIHARTRNQFFKGQPDWNSVKAVKDAVSIPVIVNGDIINKKTANQALKSSFADGIMVGRGTIGRPWLISDLSKSFNSSLLTKRGKSIFLNELIKLHFHKILDFYGRPAGLKIFRKHLGYYLHNFKPNLNNRRSLMTEESIVVLESKIKSLFQNKKVEVYDA